MKSIQEVIDIVSTNQSREMIINFLGQQKKVFNNILFLEPKMDGIKTIKIILNENSISSILFSLKECVNFYELVNYFSEGYSCLYNHYDDETWVNFGEHNKYFTFHAIKEGYIDKNKLDKKSFQKFEIKFIN